MLRYFFRVNVLCSLKRFTYKISKISTFAYNRYEKCNENHYNGFNNKDIYCLGVSLVFSALKNVDDVIDKDLKQKITYEELSKHNCKENGIWVSFRGKVYDITEYIDLHPGGKQILLAAGSDVSAFWSIYAFHYKKNITDILNDYYIGDLEDSDFIDLDDSDAIYEDEPVRDSSLAILAEKPFNAEAQTSTLCDQLITPTQKFFVRNHHLVPKIDLKTYTLNIDSGIYLKDDAPLSISLDYDHLTKDYPRKTIISTVVCAGNRRYDMLTYDHQRASEENRKPYVRGLEWKHGALSTAQWSGVLLADLLAHQLLPPDERSNYHKLLEIFKKSGVRHVHFNGTDESATGNCYGSSIPIEWALDPKKDVLIAFEMNGEPLTLDHGYPLRVVVPGSIGARQVKWLKQINLSDEESSSFWQKEDYKMSLPQADGTIPDFKNIPAISDYPVQSAICFPSDGQLLENEGFITVKGYAFSGGGRGISHVRVSSNNGNSWHEASLFPTSQPLLSSSTDKDKIHDDEVNDLNQQNHWAWTLWSVTLPIEKSASEMELVCVAMDSSYNVQPETCKANLNVRGLISNCWHRIKIGFH